eukprot:SAG31_NODE_26454_length_442_cov_0.641399_1_plen_84_part_10
MGLGYEMQLPPGGLSPALSLREDARLQVNFGERPFDHPIPAGFLPLHCQHMAQVAKLPADKAQSMPPPSWGSCQCNGLRRPAR